MNPFDDAADDDADAFSVTLAVEAATTTNGMSNGKVCARYMFFLMSLDAVVAASGF